MGLDKKLQIPELYHLKHRNDNLAVKPNDIEEKILSENLSGFIYENPQMSNFIKRFKNLVYMIFNQMYIMKNFKNFNVSKYYDKGID